MRRRNPALAKARDGQPTRDRDAGWHVKADSRGTLKSTYGYSVHTGVDEDGFIHRQTVTAGNVHDSIERDTLLLGTEAALYADAAYSSQATRDKLAKFGIADRVQRKGYRGHPLRQADKARNAEIAVTRSGGERPFATYKTRYGLARTRLMGLAEKPDPVSAWQPSPTTSRRARNSCAYTACQNLHTRDKCAQNQETTPETAPFTASTPPNARIQRLKTH